MKELVPKPCSVCGLDFYSDKSLSTHKTKCHMKAAIFARVSTDKQEAKNQLAELREYCVATGYEIAQEYIEVESGGKSISERPRFKEMFLHASQRRFQVVVFWSLDRFSREGMRRTVEYLQRLESYGVKFRSYKEEFLSTENEMVRDILLTVMASLAKQERLRISERTKAGLERVRREGTKSGRPIGRPSLDLSSRIAALQAEEPEISKNMLARRLGVSRNTVLKHLRA